MGQNDKQQKNLRLELELENPVYDVVGKAIMKTAIKHSYGKYDIARLIMAIYDKDYAYLTADEDYRDQVAILDAYFEKEYGHRLITLELIKTIKAFKGTDIYDTLTADIASLETLIRTNKKIPAEDLCIFSAAIEASNYDELMTKIETEKSMSYATAIIYDKIKNTQKGM